MSDTTMTDLAERMARVEEAQRGLNTYLPLLLKRFEGIEDRLETDLKTIEQKLETNLKETEQKLESDLKEARQEREDIRKEARDGNRNIIISVLATAITLIVTGVFF